MKRPPSVETSEPLTCQPHSGPLYGANVPAGSVHSAPYLHPVRIPATRWRARKRETPLLPSVSMECAQKCGKNKTNKQKQQKGGFCLADCDLSIAMAAALECVSTAFFSFRLACFLDLPPAQEVGEEMKRDRADFTRPKRKWTRPVTVPPRKRGDACVTRLLMARHARSDIRNIKNKAGEYNGLSHRRSVRF